MVQIKDVICDVLYNDLSEISQRPYLKNISNKTILVTGATGFIAYYIIMSLLLANDLNSSNNKIALLLRNKTKAEKRYGTILKRDDVVFLEQDVCNPLPDNFKADFIIHAASSADAKQFESNPVGTFNANVIGTNNILNFASRIKCQSMVYVSSFMVYGQGTDKEISISEDFNGVEGWSTYRKCYAYGKRSGEMLCQCHLKQYNVPIKIVRPGFIYGASTVDDSRVYAEIIRKVSKGENIVLKSSGLVYRSMCYVTDLVRAIFSALFYGEDGEAYNASTEHVSIRQYAEYAIQAFDDKGLKVIYENAEDEHAEPPSVVFGAMSSYKLLEECSWKPKVTILDGIKMAAIINQYGLDIK